MAQYRLHPALFSLLALMLLTGPAFGKDKSQTEIFQSFLSTDAIGAKAFLKAHPTWDGRDVVIAVMDTGVDMGAPGLRTTPDGEPKVILVRDFSGQGTIQLDAPVIEKRENVTLLRSLGAFLELPTPLSPAPKGGLESVKMGVITELSFVNSGVHDLNGNGNTTDWFPTLVYQSADDGEWVILTDTNGDHRVSDEKPLQSYEKAFDTFAFQGFDPAAKNTPLNFAWYFDPERSLLELNFDDGGHGTHVAGIAAGYHLKGEEGYNGIAPGAKVISLKIGNNALAGGSTTTESKSAAFKFIGKWAKDNDKIVVMNMSYGIGSEVEGDSDIDRALDNILAEYPNHLFMSTSAGNSGPGISTVGQPAASILAFTAAAALTQGNARGLYGSKISGDKVFSFSSRGGELNKPTALLPGVAASSVPPFLSFDRMAGTSMAAPQGAGAHALLLSGAIQSKMTVNNGMLRRALRASGKPLPGYTLLDQGGGMVQLKSAFAHLRGLAKSAEAQTVLGYRVSTFNPISPDWESPASYWRTGTVQMDRADSIEFHIDPIFPKSVEAATRDQFYQSYKLKSDSPWIDINTSSVYIRGDGGVNVSIRLNPDQLRTPGLHVGRVKAIASGAGNGSSVPAFELVTTVVSPFSFEPHHGYARTWKSKTIGVGDVDRYFLLVPPGATSLALDLDLARSTTGWLRLEVFDPQGRAIRPANRIADTANGGKARVLVSGYTIKPGVWEVDVYSSFRNRNKVRYDLNATFKGLDAPFFTNIEMPQGQSPVIYGTITNLFDQVFHGKGSGEVDGYARRMRLETTGDTFEHPFHIAGDTKKVTFELEMDPLAFARFTDVAINILDGSGKAVVKGGFSQAKTKVVFANPKPGAYTMEIKGAMTNEASKVWSLVIKERFLTHDRVPVTVKHRGSTNLSFYPNVATDLDTYLTRRPKAVPDGYQYAGEIRFVNRKDNRTWLTLPLRLEP